MIRQSLLRPGSVARGAALPVAATAVLIGLSGARYLVFHTIAEAFAVGVGLSLFFVSAPLARAGAQPEAALLGAGYFWVALLDLLHLLTYEGMELHPEGGADMSAQLWLAGRVLEALVLVLLPLRLARPARGNIAFFGLGALAVAAWLAVSEGVFPTAYVPGQGLTAFKIVGEYVVIGLLIAALALLRARRDLLEPGTVALLTLSILCTIAAELLFTAYLEIDGAIIAAGHILKFWSYWFILRALLQPQGARTRRWAGD